jgi:aerobic-type carbon monoxide dehydrogenase small subunit (CoxS/CutS family)
VGKVLSFVMLTAGGVHRRALSLGSKRLMCGNARCNSCLMLLNFSAVG